MKHKLSLVSCLTVKHVTGFTSEPYCGLTGRVAVCKNGSVSEKTMAAILQLSQNAEMEGSDWCMMWKISVYDTMQHELSDWTPVWKWFGEILSQHAAAHYEFEEWTQNPDTNEHRR